MSFDAAYSVPRSFYIEIAMRTSWVRSAWYSLRFRGIVLVGRGTRVRVHRRASVRLAKGAMLTLGLTHDSAAGAVLRMHPRAALEVSGRVQVMRSSSVTIGYDATLSVGHGTFVNDGSSIVCHERVTIGRDCAISWGVRIMDTDVHELVRDGVGRDRHRPVELGDRCWLGAGAIVLKGVALGDDCVVAAGSVVTSDAGPGQLLVGTPARIAAKDVSWRP